MPKPTQHALEIVMANLSLSKDKNDQAFCASIASLLGAWTAGNAETFLHHLRLVENRKNMLTGQMPAFSLN